MDQAKSNVSQTAAFARRVVCRTLTVVGGVAAGYWREAVSGAAEPAPRAAAAPPG